MSWQRPYRKSDGSTGISKILLRGCDENQRNNFEVDIRMKNLKEKPIDVSII